MSEFFSAERASASSVHPDRVDPPSACSHAAPGEPIQSVLELKDLLPGDVIEALRRDIHRLATGMLRAERPDHTLQATAIINELWLKLAHRDELRFPTKEAFLAYATEGIRHILVDHARKRLAARRGGAQRRVPFDANGVAAESTDEWAVTLQELDEELEELRKQDFRSARVFELRFFGGMTNEQIGDVLGVSGRTIRKDWAAACGWLGARLDAKTNQSDES